MGVQVIRSIDKMVLKMIGFSMRSMYLGLQHRSSFAAKYNEKVYGEILLKL